MESDRRTVGHFYLILLLRITRHIRRIDKFRTRHKMNTCSFSLLDYLKEDIFDVVCVPVFTIVAVASEETARKRVGREVSCHLSQTCFDLT